MTENKHNVTELPPICEGRLRQSIRCTIILPDGTEKNNIVYDYGRKAWHDLNGKTYTPTHWIPQD